MTYLTVHRVNMMIIKRTGKDMGKRNPILGTIPALASREGQNNKNLCQHS
jgi:hypothetical protein